MNIDVTIILKAALTHFVGNVFLKMGELTIFFKLAMIIQNSVFLS